ncbi:DUF6686 family protein [Marivirga tractuosa]|jgi:hypothetical protein|uniref:DUF6686 family protein n=1 Tax=Marivirga tractuosa TaxID=1006 RepID=UPI0035CF4A24
MCENKNSITLFESGRNKISYCKGCKSYSLIYKTTCFSIPEAHYEEYHTLLKSLSPKDFHYFIEENYYTLIKNPIYPVGFCLSPEDATSLIEMMEQARLVEEAFSILYN